MSTRPRATMQIVVLLFFLFGVYPGFATNPCGSPPSRPMILTAGFGKSSMTCRWQKGKSSTYICGTRASPSSVDMDLCTSCAVYNSKSLQCNTIVDVSVTAAEAMDPKDPNSLLQMTIQLSLPDGEKTPTNTLQDQKITLYHSTSSVITFRMQPTSVSEELELYFAPEVLWTLRPNGVTSRNKINTITKADDAKILLAFDPGTLKGTSKFKIQFANSKGEIVGQTKDPSIYNSGGTGGEQKTDPYD